MESSPSEVMGAKTPTGRDHIGARREGEPCCVNAGSEGGNVSMSLRKNVAANSQRTELKPEGCVAGRWR